MYLIIKKDSRECCYMTTTKRDTKRVIKTYNLKNCLILKSPRGGGRAMIIKEI